MKKLIIPIMILLSFSVVASGCIVDSNCFWCGTSCVEYDPDLSCIQIAPPSSMDCKCVEEKCQAVPKSNQITFPDQEEWLNDMKSIYSDYIDSGQFFSIAIIIFFPIVIVNLFALTIGVKARVSMFLLELILGVLMFLVYPYLNQILTEMIV